MPFDLSDFKFNERGKKIYKRICDDCGDTKYVDKKYKNDKSPAYCAHCHRKRNSRYGAFKKSAAI